MKRISIIIMLAATLLGCSQKGTEGQIKGCSPQPETETSALDGEKRTHRRIQVLVHRGANALAPENTMASADSALVHGADWIEVDVRTTRDGVMFNLHDDELERTTDGTGLLSESTADYISSLDCGAWFSEEYRGLPVPTMREMLKGLKGRARVFFDVKNGSVADLIALVRETGFDGDKSFFWFKQEEMLREFVRLAPDLKIKVNANDTTRLQYWMTLCTPAYVEVHANALTDEFIDYCHQRNIQVMVGAQGENLEDYSKALNYDVDIINLDKPELFEQLQSAQGKWAFGD